MGFLTGFILLFIISTSRGNLLQNVVDKMNKDDNKEHSFCRIKLYNRQLVGCDMEPVEDTVSEGTVCTFINDDSLHFDGPVETFICDNGFLLYINHKSTGTGNGHVIRKRFLSLIIGAVVGGVAAGLICKYALNQLCAKDDSDKDSGSQNKPPTITCPKIKDTWYAEKLQSTVIVTWDDPIATDPEGDVNISLQGSPKNSRFDGGRHTLMYTATDTAGYSSQCFFSFQIIVIYCYYGESLFVQHGRAVCDTRNRALYGEKCTFICDTGYQLSTTDVATKTCEKAGSSGEWQPSSNAVCERKKCSSPPSQCNGGLTCTDGNSFESVCYPTCYKGYSTDQTKHVRCNGDEWVGTIQPCIDIQPPKFTTCIESVHAFANVDGNAVVDWMIPQAKDNSEDYKDLCDSDREVTVSQIYGKSPKSSFKKGFHNITYSATDSSNNSESCKFTVIVEELSCNPLTVQDKFLLSSCPNGFSLGSTCLFSCFLSYQLVGDSNVTCQKHPQNANIAFWDWSNGAESFCEKLTCPVLPPPEGGALACSTALGNHICTMSCSYNHSVAKGTSKEYVCNSNQVWIQGIPPNCTERVHPANAILPGELFYYYQGSCSDQGIQEGIKNNYIKIMKSLEGTKGWENICPSYCTVEGVTVTCGPLNGRRRRSNYKRSITNEIVVNFKISSQWESNKTLWGNDDTLTLLGNFIKYEANSGTFDVNETTTGSMTFGYLEFPCPIGQEPVYETNARCVGCLPGNYLQDGNCIKCHKGFFQDKQYQINCTKCPEEKSTTGNGSTSGRDCIDKCPPGKYSATGVEPCSPCPLGQYQSMFESTSCLLCNSSEFTTSTGSTNKTDCQEMDLTFTSDEASVKLGPLTTNITNFSLGFFVKCQPEVNTTLIFTLVNFLLLVRDEITFAVDEHSLNNSVSKEVNLRKWSQVTMTWDKNSKEVKIYGNGANIVSSLLHNVSSQETDIPAGSFFEIKAGESGCSASGLFLISRVLSENEITVLKDTCIVSLPNSVYSMSNVFTAEMTGTELSPSECDVIDECEDSPCGNANVCIDKKNGYECQCSGGYAGMNCDIPPDFCVLHDCANGSTCFSHFTNYTCQCSTDYTGVFCETKIVHGNWGTWIETSHCSVSCGGGSLTRTRYCNNPSPGVYGMDCEGSNTTQIFCNNHNCPVCPPYYTIREYKNSFNCSTDADSISCVVTCKNGYTFVKDHFPLDKYECGPQTDYSWNVRPPPCASVNHPRSLAIRTIATYTIDCDDRTQMSSTLSTKLNELPCIQNQTCSMTTEISGCPNSGRRKRSLSVDVSIQLYTNLTQIGDLNLDDFYANNIVSPGLLDLLQTYTDIAESVDQFNKTDILTVDVNGNVYTTDTSSLSFTSKFECPEGSVNEELLCVECPVRTYWSDGFCVVCPKGYFQDTAKQLSCKACPEGYTTEFIASRNESECTVPYTITTEADSFVKTTEETSAVPYTITTEAGSFEKTTEEKMPYIITTEADSFVKTTEEKSAVPGTITTEAESFVNTTKEKSADNFVVISVVATVVFLFCIAVIIVILLIYRKRCSNVFHVQHEKNETSGKSTSPTEPRLDDI